MMMTECMSVPELTLTLIGLNAVLSPCLTSNRAGFTPGGRHAFSIQIGVALHVAT